MDGFDDHPVRVIGFLGRRDISAADRALLIHIGRLVHLLGRRIALIPSEGVANAVREGVIAEGGAPIELETDVIGSADYTFVIPDRRLLLRLTERYPDLKNRKNVAIVPTVTELHTAIATVAIEKGIE